MKRLIGSHDPVTGESCSFHPDAPAVTVLTYLQANETEDRPACEPCSVILRHYVGAATVPETLSEAHNRAEFDAVWSRLECDGYVDGHGGSEYRNKLCDWYEARGEEIPASLAAVQTHNLEIFSDGTWDRYEEWLASAA